MHDNQSKSNEFVGTFALHFKRERLSLFELEGVYVLELAHAQAV